MTDPNNAAEMLNAKSVLKNLYELAESSGMADAETMRGMSAGLHEFSAILRRKNDFAGIPGQAVRNEAKRSRLALLICPEYEGCI